MEFPGWVNEITKDLIVRMLTVDTKKRIKLEEIKNHEFYMNGEAQIKKENQNLADMEKVEEYVIELIKEMGITRDEVLKNLRENNYNNITTTFYLLVNKYKLNPNLIKAEGENKLKERLKNSFPRTIDNILNVTKNLSKINQSLFINRKDISSNINNNRKFIITIEMLKKPVNPFKNLNSEETPINNLEIINSISKNDNIPQNQEKLVNNINKEYNLL